MVSSNRNSHKGRVGATSKEVAKPSAGSVPAVYDYGEDAGAGFEDMGRESFAIPFLYLLQSNSPVVVEDSIPGVKAGYFMNTVTREIYPAIKAKDEAGIIWVPCFSEHLYTEWKPIDAGGGFVGQHKPDDDMVLACKANQSFGKMKTPSGNDLVDTFYSYGIHVKNAEAGEFETALIAFTSTKIRPYRTWMTRLKTMKIPTVSGGKIIPPMWAHQWRFTTVMQKKDVHSFYNLEVAFAYGDAAASRLAPDHPVYIAGKELNELCKEGALRPATESLHREPGDDSDVIEGEKVPF